MPKHPKEKERKKYSYAGNRIPATILYPEHKEAVEIIEPYWKRLMGRKYAFAEVQRHLLLQEAERIKAEQAALAKA